MSSPKRTRITVENFTSQNVISTIQESLTNGQLILMTKKYSWLKDIIDWESIFCMDIRCRLRMKNDDFRFNPVYKTYTSLFWSFLCNTLPQNKIYMTMSHPFNLPYDFETCVTMLMTQSNHSCTNGWCLRWDNTGIDFTNYKLLRDNVSSSRFVDTLFLKDIKILPQTPAQFLTLYMFIGLECDFRIIDSVFYGSGSWSGHMKYKMFTFGMDRLFFCHNFTINQVD